jgi:glycerol uptake facilitator protein
LHIIGWEIVGTALLILLGDGVVAAVLLNKSKAQNSGWIVITWGWGMAVMVAVFSINQFTGAHLNPAVTVGLWVAGVTDGGDVPKYLIGEFVGAFIGAALVLAAYWDHFRETEDPGLKLAVFSTGPAIRNYPMNVVTEIIGTFVLVYGVLSMLVANKAGTFMIAGGQPLIVGLLVLGIGLSHRLRDQPGPRPRTAHRARDPAGPGQGAVGLGLLVGARDRAAHRWCHSRGHVPLVVRALGGAR